MKFIDKVHIYVEAGKGGDGVVAFRREAYVPKGGPAGGDGGKGGSIIFEATTSLSTLLDFRYNREYKAKAGGQGMAKKMHGADAADRVLKVPVGTVIYDEDTGKVLADLVKDGQRAVIAKGGRGGRGNTRFATSRNPAPTICERGEPGEKHNLICELKLLADVGLVGFPSVGKSTFLSVVSRAKPEIADYHFTTIVPNLGVVQAKDGRSFVMADLPGLIEGAHLGLGLGIQFLKHIERTRVIVHVIDMSSSEGRDPIDDYKKINNELESYNLDLMKKPQIIVANKMDLPDAMENLKRFKEELNIEHVIPISAATRDNLNTLIYAVADLLDEIKVIPDPVVETDIIEYNFKKDEEPFTLELCEDGVYNVIGPMIEKLMQKTDFNNDPSIRRFAKQLRDLGVDEALREKGVKDGDSVRILDYEFEFYD